MWWCFGGRLSVITVVVALVFAAPACSARAAAARFIGDFETGNFDQWSTCQNADVGVVSCSDFHSVSPSMAVETDVVRQGRFAARFRLRPGDQPEGLCCGDRAEVSGDDQTAANEGDDRWYQWSTRFGDEFPADQGWSVVAQWHAYKDGSPPLAFNAGPANVGVDQWGIVLQTWIGPGDPGPIFTPWSGPVVRGVWRDIKLHVKWSSTDSVGFIEFWLNGVPQTFAGAPCPGQTRCMVRTLMPGGGGVYFKQGYYRDPSIAGTGVVYHDGFSDSDSEAGLAPL